MIGGRVLDVTAVVGFSTGQSVYAEALVMTAIEENIVLTVPAAVLARSSALIPRGHELGLDVLLVTVGHPVLPGGLLALTVHRDCTRVGSVAEGCC